jgi:hypothetical protein
MNYVIDEDAMAKDPRTKVAYQVYKKLRRSDLSNEDVVEVMALLLCLFVLTNARKLSPDQVFARFLGHCSRLIPVISFQVIKSAPGK